VASGFRRGETGRSWVVRFGAASAIIGTGPLWTPAPTPFSHSGRFLMADFVTLTCPSCGGKLQITSDLDRFACGYCGTEQVVRRGGGVVSLAPVVEGLKQVQVGVDKTASELAIRRLREDIAELEEQVEAARTPSFFSTGPGLVTIVAGGALIVAVVAKVEWLILLSALLIAGLIVRSLLTGRQDRQTRLALQEEIERKEEELAKHERLVSG
jgi:hypothetical protein